MPFSAYASAQVTLAATLLFTTLLTVAAAFDWRTRRIPNEIVITLVVAGLACAAIISPEPLAGVARSAGGIAVGLLLWLPFYALRWIGAGDVKLFAAASAWLGPERAVIGSLVAALLGGILAALWMLRTHGVRDTAMRMAVGVAVARAEFGRVDAHSPRAIPYGVTLAIGAFAAAWIPPLLQGGYRGVR